MKASGQSQQFLRENPSPITRLQPEDGQQSRINPHPGSFQCHLRSIPLTNPSAHLFQCHPEPSTGIHLSGQHQAPVEREPNHEAAPH